MPQNPVAHEFGMVWKFKTQMLAGHKESKKQQLMSMDSGNSIDCGFQRLTSVRKETNGPSFEALRNQNHYTDSDNVHQQSFQNSTGTEVGSGKGGDLRNWSVPDSNGYPENPK